MKLLSAVDCEEEIHLIIGALGGNITYQRALKSIQVGAKPLLVHDADVIDANLQSLVEQDMLQWNQKKFEMDDLQKLGRLEVDGVVDKVFVIESNIKQEIYQVCKKLRIPINTYQSQNLSTFTLLSTYNSNDLQIGVTTSGMGCNLSSRIKREIVKSLPSNIDEIVSNIGSLRRELIKEDGEDFEYSNEMVYEFAMTKEDKFLRRSRWLTQMIEYYPLSKLSLISISDFHQQKKITSHSKFTRKGSITLVGSGPGSISCLTIGALNAIKTCDLILLDKLIPQEILDLVPNSTQQFIAKKFPGNAEAAQQELYDLAMDGFQKGLKVVRLKQGDPFIYGRGGEEVLYFKSKGIKVDVLPGLTSALTAPLFGGIPATHRGITDKVLICTGTGSKGSTSDVPDYDSKRTTIFLMAIHRLENLVGEMLNKKWDCNVPCCVIEKASSADQRIVRSQLKDIVGVMTQLGSRPPGLLVVGWSCGVLESRYEIVDGVTNPDNEEFGSVMNMIRKCI